MTTALVPTVPGRPVWVTDEDGWRVCVAVHDRWHLQERAKLRARQAREHPDAGPFRQHSRLSHCARAMRGFYLRELAWYGALGLAPPTRMNGAHVVPMLQPFDLSVLKVIPASAIKVADVATALGFARRDPRVVSSVLRLEEQGAVKVWRSARRARLVERVAA